MSAVEIQSEAFARAALKSERVRVLGLLWALTALVVIAAVRAFAFGAADEQRLLVSIIGVAAVMTAYETLVLRLVGRSIADERTVPPWAWSVNVFVETLFPTATLIVLAESRFMPPYQALVAPAGLVYFVFIVLSTLRLSPALSRLTGLVSGAGYRLRHGLRVLAVPRPSWGQRLLVPHFRDIRGVHRDRRVCGGVGRRADPDPRGCCPA